MARLFGAADAPKNTVGESIPPSERTQYDGDMAMARNTLAPGALQITWNAGRADNGASDNRRQRN